MAYSAHSRTGPGGLEWQPLDEHLRNVADLAAHFAADFGGQEWARLAGLWHDLGKYSNEFQRYLAQVTADPHLAETAGRVDHSTAGAQHAVASIDVLGHLLAFVIAGHHAGLPDAQAEGACLDARLGKVIPDWKEAPADLLVAPMLEPPSFLGRAFGRRDGSGAFTTAFFTRMVFSCLVDADFLDTEEFMDSARAKTRPSWPADTLERMECVLRGHTAALAGSEATPVNAAREGVREACLRAAEAAPGLFSLTVPTGGGKTLSSLAFALRHARKHGLRRVVYVAPFTTIIEQNADVFRRALETSGDLGPDLVVEHHSNLGVDKETTRSRLATENWDAPLVVTTSVQLYESLFANRPSACRKLHNLSRAVIVLDEAQALPVELLEPCLTALRELASHYGATVVLCTATQPAITRREEFPIGLDGVREIIPDRQALYESLRRIELVDLGALPDSQLAALLLTHERVLCIVNTRKHARSLFEAIGTSADGHFHLSASMCPEHRTVVLKKIRERLDRPTGGVCRLVSTQVVEAGVDIDFPVVFRSMAGLDSIAQAAGRCNRHGRLGSLGKVFLFRSEHRSSEAFLRQMAQAAEMVLPLHPADALSLEGIESYFRLYYWSHSGRWDKHGVLDRFAFSPGDQRLPFVFSFATAAREFRVIEEIGKPVIVPWGERGVYLVEELRREGEHPDRRLLRALQRFTVSAPRRAWEANLGGSVELLNDRYAVLADPSCYSPLTGLGLPDAGGFLEA